MSFFSKSSQTFHNETFKFCSFHVSLAADEVSRKFIRRFSSKSSKYCAVYVENWKLSGYFSWPECLMLAVTCVCLVLSFMSLIGQTTNIQQHCHVVIFKFNMHVYRIYIFLL